MLNQYPRSKKRNFKIPYIVDLVEDNVRSRLIFPAAMLAIYVLVAFAITNITPAVYFFSI